MSFEMIVFALDCWISTAYCRILIYSHDCSLGSHTALTFSNWGPYIKHPCSNWVFFPPWECVNAYACLLHICLPTAYACLISVMSGTHNLELIFWLAEERKPSCIRSWGLSHWPNVDAVKTDHDWTFLIGPNISNCSNRPWPNSPTYNWGGTCIPAELGWIGLGLCDIGFKWLSDVTYWPYIYNHNDSQWVE